MSNPPRDPDTEEGAGFPEDDLFQRRERNAPPNRGRPRVVSEFVRRAIENTVGSVQSTGSVSKEALAYLLQQGDKGRKEVMRVVAKEVGDFLRQTDVSSEIVKVLTNIQVDVSASVKFRPSQDHGAVRPEFGGETTVRLVDADGRDLLHDEPEEPESDPPRAEPNEAEGDNRGGG
jgi:hypothetical protein